MKQLANAKVLRASHLSFLLLFSFFLNAQVTILGTGINAYNITPRAMADISISNPHPNTQAVLEAQLYNSSGELLITIKTNPFTLYNGLNMTSALNISIAGADFGLSNQANYVKMAHVLPTGQFRYCCRLFINSFDETEEYCTEVESLMSDFLMLISPGNKDTIDTPYPALVWNHSQPFNLMASGEFFRMVVVELSPEQSAEAGVTVNVPIMTQNYLHDHTVVYPMNAKELAAGKRYGWQVQALTNGVITNKTEAWEFTLKVPRSLKDHKYATLRQAYDGGFYTTENNKLFFRFDEAYSSNTLSCKIFDSEMNPVKPKVSNEASSGREMSLKNSGYNRFEVDLDQFDVSSGFYTLEVKNEKNEKFVMKFLIK